MPCGISTVDRPAHYDHVVWIWFENHTNQQVIGSRAAPYTSAVASQCGTAARYSSIGSPSLPNYIGATSGDTHGITDDAGPPLHPIDSDNIFRQVRASGRVERSYLEAMQTNCATAASGRYAVKHNPAAYYTGADDRQACMNDDVPLGSIQSGALASAIELDTLPAFSFITPDLCNDTHDCSVGTGDAWLATWLPMLLDAAAYRRGHTAIFVVWDEPTPMPFIVLTPTVPSGRNVDAAIDHYALLRTTQELLAISPLLGRAATAPSLRDAFNL
jgi:hypothetical protein